jgi:hypothetical protein
LTEKIVQMLLKVAPRRGAVNFNFAIVTIVICDSLVVTVEAVEAIVIIVKSVTFVTVVTVVTFVKYVHAYVTIVTV